MDMAGKQTNDRTLDVEDGTHDDKARNIDED
jgi:hypothetical protein